MKPSALLTGAVALAGAVALMASLNDGDTAHEAAPLSLPQPQDHSEELRRSRALEILLEDAHDRLDVLEGLLRGEEPRSYEIIPLLKRVPDEYAELRTAQAARGPWARERGDALAEYLRSAEACILAAFQMDDIHTYQLDENSPPRGLNGMTELNVVAAEALAETGNRDLAGTLIDEFRKMQAHERFEICEEVLKAVIEATRTLDPEAAFAWLTQDFVDSDSKPRNWVDLKIVAHRAMLKFDAEKVPGATRFELVRRLLAAYVGTERRVRETRDEGPADDKLETALIQAEMFWEKIGPSVIDAIRHFAGHPTDKQGQRLESLGQLQAWLTDHQDLGSPPWSDS